MVNSVNGITVNNPEIKVKTDVTGGQSSVTNSVMPENTQLNNNDDLQVSNNSAQNNETNQKTTLKEICNTLNSYLNKYGFTVKEDDVERILKEVFNIDGNKLQNINSADLNNDIKKYILPALEKFKNSSDVTLEQILLQAKDWHIAINQGKWNSIEEYEKAQQSAINTYGKPECITERVKRVTGKDLSKLTNENDIKNAIAEYTNWLLKQAKGQKDPGKFISQDLIRLINNTKDDNIRGLFFDVINDMANSESYKKLPNYNNSETAMNAIIATVRSYTDANKRSEDIVKHNVISIVDGLDISKEEKIETTSTLVESITTEEHARKFDEQVEDIITPFYEENKAVLDKILQKKIEATQKGVELVLTPEEQKVYEEFQNKCVALRTGQTIGLANNENLPAELKLLLVNEIQVADSDKKLLQRDTLAEIHKFVQENQDSLNMSVEDFEKIMDEATEGNYTIVKNDVANNTYTDLKPVESIANQVTSELDEDSSNATTGIRTDKNVGGLGYDNSKQAPVVNLEQKKDAILNNDNIENIALNTNLGVTLLEENSISADKALRTGNIDRYKKVTGFTGNKLTEALLNIGSKYTTAFKHGLERFANLGKSAQLLIYEGLKNNSARVAVLGEFSLLQLLKIEGNNHYMQTKIDEKREEQEQKIKKPFEASV